MHPHVHTMEEEEKKPLNFIEQIIEEDLENGLDASKLRFRFPPEPNGYLHIGHTKAICINFGLGQNYNAPVNLRFDDTNPAKEEQEFVDSIKADINWLGFKYDQELYTSDYFEQLLKLPDLYLFLLTYRLMIFFLQFLCYALLLRRVPST